MVDVYDGLLYPSGPMEVGPDDSEKLGRNFFFLLYRQTRVLVGSGSILVVPPEVVVGTRAG